MQSFRNFCFLKNSFSKDYNILPFRDILLFSVILIFKKIIHDYFCFSPPHIDYQLIRAVYIIFPLIIEVNIKGEILNFYIFNNSIKGKILISLIF